MVDRVGKKADDALRERFARDRKRLEYLLKAIDAIRVLASARTTVAERNILQICNAARKGESWKLV
jgi:hypothetical protein